MSIRFLLAIAFVVTSSPAFVSAQDFFWSFDENSRVDTQNVFAGPTPGTVYLFADENLDFNQLDLNFFLSNAAVVSFTGGSTFNPPAFTGGRLFLNFQERSLRSI